MRAFWTKVEPRVSVLSSLIICGGAVVLMAFLRFQILPPQYSVPLNYALPLFLCLWSRDQRFLLAMCVVFSGMMIFKGVVNPLEVLPYWYRVLGMTMNIFNLWVIAFFINQILIVGERLEKTNKKLEDANNNLENLNRELLEHKTKLAADNQMASEISRRKTRFLAAVSHDVRTPANAIALSAELIGRISGNPSMASMMPEVAEGLKRSSRNLVELVSDVLDLTRFDSGRIDVELQEFRLKDFLEKEVQQHALAAQQKGLTLKIEPLSENLLICTDRLKLARIFGNLMANAVKYTETGSVTIRTERAAKSILVEVIDTGVGIPKRHLDDIFDEYFQLSNKERDRQKGSGLGLAICRRLAEALRCRLSVSSVLGQGSTFGVEIPNVSPAGEAEDLSFGGRLAPSGARLDKVTPRLEGLRVLLVEDHELTRTSMQQILQDEGATVSGVSEGAAVVEALLRESPDVLLLDLMLPDMDTIEILERVRGAKHNHAFKILVISADLSPTTVESARALGAESFLVKPIPVDTLIELLIPYVPKDRSPGNSVRETPVRT